jgi:hypothetical protein
MALALATVSALTMTGCRPDFGPSPSLVAAPRVLAVRFDPPEAPPGTRVDAKALVASPAGTMQPSLAWSICRAPKPAVENDVVSAACLTPDGITTLTSTSAPLAITLPSDGCRLFGPETPPAMAGQPPLQPRAPDVTGGYYQPVRADLDGSATIALARIRCALAGASMDAATEFAARYVANRNPTLLPLTATVDGAPVALDALPAGRAVQLTVGFTPESVESFPVLDPQTQTLTDQLESLAVSWFVSGGSLASENSDGGNVWTAPPSPATTYLWIVLRDSRGGIDFAAHTLLTH